ncbi:MAG: PEGA domain-containing protein [Pseudomonadota bacterium]
MVEIMKSSPLAITFLLLFSSTALAESILAVRCATEDEGAEVFVNGEFRGDCPANLFLPPGEKTVRVVKPVDDERERVYETTLQLVDDSVERVTVELSRPQLTAEARQKRERARLEREKKAAELAMKKAKDGDTDAMRELADYYRNGEGVSQDAEKANEWAKRADKLDSQRLASKTLERAEAGSVQAMQQMADRYESGSGVPQDDSKAREWRRRANQIVAEDTLEKAEDGSVDAMKTMATLYEDGKGVEKDSEKAQEWANRAETVTAEREQRKKEREQQAAARERNKALQAAIDNTEYLEYTHYRVTDLFRRGGNGESFFGFLSAITLSPFATGSGLVSDMLLAPTKSTDVALWKSRMTSRPAAFENPDSMIANAYANRRSSAD